MPNTILKRWNGSAFEELYPKTTVGQISASGTPSSSTFLRGDGQWQTPATQSHTHGNISYTGTATNADYSPGSGVKIMVSDSTNTIGKSNIAFSGAGTGFLRQDGAWATPAGSITGSGTSNQIAYWTGTTTVGALTTASYPSLTELSYVKGVTSAIQTQLNDRAVVVKAYKASTTTASSGLTAVSAISLTLLANNYYQLHVVGSWSKSYGGSSAFGTSVSMAVNNTTGTPTFTGSYQWATTPTATSLTIESEASNLSTSTTAHGFTSGVSTSSVSASYFAINGFIYAGTSNKTLTFYVAKSADFTGGATIDKISAVAIKVN